MLVNFLKKELFFAYSILSTNYLYFKFQSISMLHYEVIHCFVHAIPVIKLLNAYPNAEKEGPTQSKCRSLIPQARELRLALFGSSGSVDYCHNN